MELGRLVKEDCSNPDKVRVGTVVKVTRYELGKDSNYWRLVKRDPDAFFDDQIRPGHVVSVRWQDDHTKLTAHVFYDGIKESVINLMGGNTIMVVE
jgi:hypothetical protein